VESPLENAFYHPLRRRGTTSVATVPVAKVLRRRIPLALLVLLVPNFVGREAGTTHGNGRIG